MIDLLNIQETSRTGFPPAPETSVSDDAVSGKSFSNYLDEAGASEIHDQGSADPPRGTGAEQPVSSREGARGDAGSTETREPGSGESGSDAKKAISKETLRDKDLKEKTGDSSDSLKTARKGGEQGLSGGPAKNGLKLSAAAEEAGTRNPSLLGEKEANSKSSKAADEKGGAGNREKVNLNKIAGDDELSDVDSLEKEISSVSQNGERLLDELKTRGLEGRNGGQKVLDSGKDGSGDSGSLKSVMASALKAGDGRLKIELSDQRENLKKSGAREEAGKADALQLKAGTASGRLTSDKNGETLSVGTGGESFDASGTGEEGETPFRVVELGTSINRDGNVETLSVNKGELAGSFKSLLQDKGVPDIVKQTGILLKDNNQGEIRLILRPESLGKVRISLNLNENNIAGRIFVENINIKDAFNSTLEELQRALRDAGFDSANLEVFVQGEGAGGSRENGDSRDDKPVLVHPSVIESIEENIPLADSSADESDIRVNLLA